MLASCNPEAVPTESDSSSLALGPGDIVVANTGADSVVVLDSTGAYKSVLKQLDASVDSPYGLAWSPDTSEVLIAINGSPDRIIAISALTGVEREIDTSGLNGNIRKISVLPNGDFAVIESNVVERFTINGSRITEDWPLSGLQSGLEGIDVNSSGNIILCSRTSDEVGVYDEEGGVVSAAIASGIAGTTDCYGANELGNGNIAVVWVGTSDTVSIYSSDLTSTVATFSDTGKISNPRAIATSLDGTQFYVIDATFNNIHLFDNDGSYVEEISPGVLSIPNDIIVIPEF